MAKIIAVTNQKGGVGKTTTAVSMADALAEKQLSVLLIDADPQGNATVACGVDKKGLQYTLLDVLLTEVEPQQAIVRLSSGLHVLPCNGDLGAFERAVYDSPQRHLQLQERIRDWAVQFDYVFIDCPPTLNLLTVNALVCAEFILVPIQCEYFALEGVSSLLETVGQLRRTVNPNLRIAGFLRTMYDARSRLTREVSKSLFDHLQGKVFRTVISRSVRLAEAPGFGRPITQYDPYSKGAKEYRKATEELLSIIG